MKIRSREINIFSMSALDLFASALGAFAKANKVALCHLLGDGNGNPEFIVIVVSERALDAHFAHGDLIANPLGGGCGGIG